MRWRCMRPQLPERDESANLQAFLLAEDLSVRDTRGHLLPTLANSHFKADHTVIVAKRQDGDIARDVIFRLNDLLRGLGNVRGVGQGEVVLNLLLDSDRRRARGGRSFRVQTLGINPDVANPKQASRAVTDGGVQRLGEYGAGGLLGKWRLSRLLQLGGLLLGLAKRE